MIGWESILEVGLFFICVHVYVLPTDSLLLERYKHGYN